MIVCEKLTKTYGDCIAVNDVSFRVPAGRVTGFLGPNGSGKSTTMRLILELDRPDSGRALVNGKKYRHIEQPLRVLGAQFDGSGAHKGRTATAHLKWICQSNAIPVTKIPEVLERVGLTSVAKKRIGGFSLGMNQRLGIAAALVGDPRILMFDEPMNGLDPEGIRWLRRFLKELAAEGKAVLVSSHLMSEIELIADNLIVIAQGRLIKQGTLKELTTGHPNLEEAYFNWTEGLTRHHTQTRPSELGSVEP